MVQPTSLIAVADLETRDAASRSETRIEAPLNIWQGKSVNGKDYTYE